MVICMVVLVNRFLEGLEVSLRAFCCEGLRRKAVAVRHALLFGVSGASVFCPVVMLYH